MPEARMTVFDSAGTEVFDTYTSLGGQVVDLPVVAASATPTFTYPSFAGRSMDVMLIGSAFGYSGDDIGATVDYSLGYPRVTVASQPWVRAFLMLVY